MFFYDWVPTTEAFQQIVRRAHHQLAQWYSTLRGVASPLNAVDYGWEADTTNKCLLPRNMAYSVPYAPEHVLKLVRCGCASEWACRGVNWGYMVHQPVCTMFCDCGSGPCSNPFNAKERTTDDTDEVDNESSEYNDNGDDYFMLRHKFIPVMP